jgi:hypothetical protein
MGGFMSHLLGLSHVTTVDPEIRLDYIPVDLCAKGMIVSAFKTYQERQKVTEIPIYNAANIKTMPFTTLISATGYQSNPPLNAVMYRGQTYTHCFFYAWIVRIFENLLPMLLLDGLLMLNGKKKK